MPNLRLSELGSQRTVTFPPLDREACEAIEGATYDTDPNYGRPERTFDATEEGTYDFSTDGYEFWD